MPYGYYIDMIPFNLTGPYSAPSESRIRIRIMGKATDRQAMLTFRSTM